MTGLAGVQLQRFRTEEGIRTGWPSIGMLPDGSIYTVAHDPATWWYGV